MSVLRKRMRKNKIKMTPIQAQMLVDILYENSEIASGKLSARFPREDGMKKWEAVATLLNSKNLGPQKTAVQWKKSWFDLKYGTRSKAAKLELAGGTDLMNEKLSHVEKRVLQLSGDIPVKISEGSESRDNLKGEQFLKKLEEDLVKTEEDLLKVLKKPNQIVLPTTLSKILEERNRKRKQMPIVENVATTEETIKKEKDNSAEVNSNCSVNYTINSDVDISLQDDGSNDDIVYDVSDDNEEAVDNPETSYEPLNCKRTRKNKIKMTPIQTQMLVDILYENSEIASGKLSALFPREDGMKKWEAVATLLNSKDLGPQKTPDQWKKSWSDLRYATRNKAAKIELAGGTDLMNEKLSHIEKRVLQLSGDIPVEISEESKEKLKGEQFMKKLEEDLLKVLKKPNQIVLPTTVSKILEEQDRKHKQMPIVENVAATEETSEKEKNNSVEVNSNCSVNAAINSDVDVSWQNDGSNDDNVYDVSDDNEEAVDNPETSYEPLSPIPKKRKIFSDDRASTASSESPKKRKVFSDDKASTASSESKSFISVFQRQIETQTAVLREQNSIMKDIAKSLRLIASSLHGS